MSGRLAHGRRPGAATPVGQAFRRLLGHAFPPDVAISGQRDVGEHGVAGARVERVLVGRSRRARRDAEEAGFRIDGIQLAIVAETHPADVVADRLGLPALQRRLEHRKVGLAAGRREGGGDVLHHAFGRGQLEDEHVLGQPTLIARHHRGDAQRVAFLSEQGVAAIARPVRPDLARFGIVDDVLVFVAGPRHVLLAGRQRRAQRVDGGNEEAIIAHLLERRAAHAGHHAHRDGDVGANP